tara:strand:- start:200694 stop:201599 length:906 start_codon:yes stop_codon:yes gene_type:complete
VAKRSGITIVRGGIIAALLALPMAASDAQDRSARGHAAGQRSTTNQNRENHSLFPTSTARQRKETLNALPMARLTPQARRRILSIAESPTFYRRLPTQAISCDRDMFLFLTRNPDVLVGIWDLLGITNVEIERKGPYQLQAVDGSGTSCTVDLVYGDPNLHVFVADGRYDGKMTAKPIEGKGVFILRSQYAIDADGGTTVTGKLDCFVHFDGIGVDLVVRTLSGLIGRSADNNFIETARFISQISQSAESNPPAMIDVAQRLPQVQPATKVQFVDVITTVAKRQAATPRTANRPLFVPTKH